VNALTGLAIGALAGAGIGAAYFLWLWWTLQGLVDRRRAGLWFVVNVAARLVLAVAGFGLVARWLGWQALAAALAGFVVARVVLLRRLTGRPDDPGGAA
jgi:F1F0 ATPase subunit 2